MYTGALVKNSVGGFTYITHTVKQHISFDKDRCFFFLFFFVFCLFCFHICLFCFHICYVLFHNFVKTLGTGYFLFIFVEHDKL